MTTVTLPVEEEISAAPASADTSLLNTYKRAPMVFVGGEGVELIDAAGKRYLDFASGIAVNALGYGDAGVAQAIAGALTTGLIHTSNLYRTTAGDALASQLTERSF